MNEREQMQELLKSLCDEYRSFVNELQDFSQNEEVKELFRTADVSEGIMNIWGASPLEIILENPKYALLHHNPVIKEVLFNATIKENKVKKKVVFDNVTEKDEVLFDIKTTRETITRIFNTLQENLKETDGVFTLKFGLFNNVNFSETLINYSPLSTKRLKDESPNEFFNSRTVLLENLEGYSKPFQKIVKNIIGNIGLNLYNKNISMFGNKEYGYMFLEHTIKNGEFLTDKIFSQSRSGLPSVEGELSDDFKVRVSSVNYLILYAKNFLKEFTISHRETNSETKRVYVEHVNNVFAAALQQSDFDKNYQLQVCSYFLKNVFENSHLTELYRSLKNRKKPELDPVVDMLIKMTGKKIALNDKFSGFVRDKNEEIKLNGYKTRDDEFEISVVLRKNKKAKSRSLYEEKSTNLEYELKKINIDQTCTLLKFKFPQDEYTKKLDNENKKQFTELFAQQLEEKINSIPVNETIVLSVDELIDNIKLSIRKMLLEKECEKKEVVVNINKRKI